MKQFELKKSNTGNAVPPAASTQGQEQNHLKSTEFINMQSADWQDPVQNYLPRAYKLGNLFARNQIFYFP